MRPEYNIYCDESCHLENDKQKAMVLGAITCPKEKINEVFDDIREIKTKNGLSTKMEIKWNKVSSSKIEFYSDLINYFFDTSILSLRVLVIPDKSELKHIDFDQTHDDFYFKMYFRLLKVIFEPQASYYVYLDIKDTKSQVKINKLKEVLRNNHYDFSKEIIKRVQQVRSHEVELVQLTDLFIGAFSYLHRDLKSSKSKLQLISLIKQKSGYSMMKSTLVQERKFNVFIWDPSLSKIWSSNV